MARKRTQAEKDKDRERKALKRSLMTEEEKQRERDQAKERMAKRNKQMSPESKEKQRQQNKERMSARRAEDREILEEYWKKNSGTRRKWFSGPAFARVRGSGTETTGGKFAATDHQQIKSMRKFITCYA